MSKKQKPKRILFVESDNEMLDQLREILAPHENQWDCALLENPGEATPLLESESFDTIVMSLDVTEPTANELITHVRLSDHHCDVPIVILSDSRQTPLVQQTLVQQALEAGASDLLRKPFDKETLVEHLRSALQLKEAQDKLHRAAMLAEQDDDDYYEDESNEEELRDGPPWGSLLASNQAKYLYQLATNIEYQGHIRGRHVLRVAYLCWEIAGSFNKILPRETGLTNRRKDFKEDLFFASMLHDIGLAEVPQELIERRSPLTANETTLLQHHCMVGAMMIREREDILQTIHGAFDSHRAQRILDMAGRICMAHHENADGSGYPLGTCHSGIPIEASIVALADRLDALVYPHSHPPPEWTEENNEFSIDYAEGELDLAVFPGSLGNDKTSIFQQAMKALNQRAPDEFNPIVFKAFTEVLPVVEQTITYLGDATMPPQAATADC